MSQATDLVHYVRRIALSTCDGMPLDRELLGAFVTHRDEAAFEALVMRHGSMVLSVCQRVLQNHHDAEDAFQAAFLVLARRAASVKPRRLLGNWLYGVAYRTALEARTVRRKRLARQRSLTDVPEAVAPLLAGEDLQLALHEELNRLPDHYRAIIVLCDLEGKTQKEAARELACPPGTVACRLTRGRSLLAKRLARHGLTLSGGALVLALSGNAALAGMPTPLVVSTVKAAATVAAGGAATSVVSAKVAALTEGVLKAMLLTKLKMLAAVAVLVVACVGILAVGGFTFRTQAADEPAFAGEKAKQKEGAVAGGAPDEKHEGVKGLKLTLSADKTETHMKPDGSDAVPVQLKLTFTNESDKPIKLNAHVLEWRMGFRCTGPSPDSVHTEIIYIKRRNGFLLAPVPADYPVLQPGKSWSPSWTRSFPGGIDEGFAKRLHYTLRKPGTYKLRLALYENLLGGDEKEAERTRWLKSNELELKVRTKEEPEAKPEGGKAVKGLVGMAEVVEKPAKGSTSFEVRFSLKNVSDKPITVCNWAGNRPLKVQWIGPDGKMLNSKHYLFLDSADIVGPTKDSYVAVPPGGVRFIGPEIIPAIMFYPLTTKEPFVDTLNLAQVGQHRVTVSFTNNEEGKEFGFQNVWTGTVTAKEVAFTVEKPEPKSSASGSREGPPDEKNAAVNGLKLSLSADKTETQMKPDGSDAVPVQLKLTFTNVSGKPIKLNAYDLRWRMGFRCTGPSPDSVHTDIELVDRQKLPPPVAKDFPLLDPGKSWSPEWNHSFPGDIQQETAKNVGYRLCKPGTYKLRFTYGNLAEGTWTGSLESNEFELKVRKKEEAEAKPEGGKAVEAAAALKEGVWIFQGRRNILSAGSDTVITIEKKQGKWLISYRHIQHFSLNKKEPPQETIEGPYELTVAGPVLEYQGPNGVEKISYRFDGDSLVMPAVVRLDERTWMMQTTSTGYDPAKKAKTTRPEKYVWRCQSDPTKIDQGEAEFPPFGRQPGASKGQYTYMFSQEKDKASRTISIVRFLNASKDKKDAMESCRLTWDTEGTIQIEARSLPTEWHQSKYSPKESAPLKVK